MSSSGTISVRRRRRGFSSILATFYVALFSGLAVAFVAFTSLNTSIAGNTRAEQAALTAAEGGLSVLRYHICNMTFIPNSSSESIFEQLGEELADQFNGTLNMSGRQVVATADYISIPEIPADVDQPSLSFSATITRESATYYLTVVGRYENVARAIRTTFGEHDGPADTSLLRHGIASRGAIRINGAALLRSNIPGAGSVMSTDPTAWPPIRVNGSGQFDGDFYMVQTGITGDDVFSTHTSTFLNADGSGYEGDVDAHTHSGVSEPTWPTVDSTPLAALAQSLPHKTIERGVDPATLGPLHNLVIKANADPTFAHNTTITGIVYVEWPNDIVFNGSLNITGLIVFQPPSFEPGIGTAATNLLRFNGAVTSRGVENLPQTAEYAGLHDQKRTFVLAPDVQVVFNGAMGTINGMIYASELTLNGATTGRVRGGIIVDRRRQFTKFDSVDLFFEYDPTSDGAAGLVFSKLKTLRPVPGSYEELTQ